jgi:hypothetical protein
MGDRGAHAIARDQLIRYDVATERGRTYRVERTDSVVADPVDAAHEHCREQRFYRIVF